MLFFKYFYKENKILFIKIIFKFDKWLIKWYYKRTFKEVGGFGCVK